MLFLNFFRKGKHSHKIVNIQPYIKKEETTGFKLKNIFACLFSVHNTISLSRHEQVLINYCIKTGFNIFKENRKIYYRLDVLLSIFGIRKN